MPFSEQQIKGLKAKLSPAHVRTREADGRALAYIEGWHAISEANRIFGFESWDRETLQATCVWSGALGREHGCSYIAKVRVTVRAGETVVVREGSGAGHGASAHPGEAHESALKEAETDALKRALSTFGNPFGLALYDKDRKGVRGSRNSQQVEARPQLWRMLSERGRVIGTFAEPVAYCRAMRQKLEEAGTAAAVSAFWHRNATTVHTLYQVAPELRAANGQHYADILIGLYHKRLQELQEPERRPEQDAHKQQAVDRSQLALPAPRRVRDKAHLEHVRSLPCLVCGRRPSQAHHIRIAAPPTLGRKPSDEWVVPLCATHHRALHDAGDEARWWQDHEIDALAKAQELWQQRRKASHGGQVDEEASQDARTQADLPRSPVRAKRSA